mmetsp:Transcript_6585/g.9608  ORF Transcript_6585/g.9608 Transcript_6585/m.9608 type:complete len:81 (+) Transcript_6585:709-951(+)
MRESDALIKTDQTVEVSSHVLVQSPSCYSSERQLFRSVEFLSSTHHDPDNCNPSYTSSSTRSEIYPKFTNSWFLVPISSK